MNFESLGFRPLGNRILGKREELPSESVIISAAETPEPVNTIRVLSVGEKVTLVNIGDIVYINKYVGTPLDDEHVVVFEQDIVGVIK
ncbi:MAG: hypothetical protein ACHQVS_00700 [Candidatus Babeliales bacterium]